MHRGVSIVHRGVSIVHIGVSIVHRDGQRASSLQISHIAGLHVSLFLW